MLQPSNFKAVSRDRLFFDQYLYCMTADLDEAGCLRQLTHKWIDRVVAVRRAYHSRIQPNSTAFSISSDEIENLHKICQLLLDTTQVFRLTVEYGCIRVYSSSTELFDNLLAVGQFKSVLYVQAVIDRDRNTVKLKNPQHQYRSYFSRTKVTDQQKQSIVQFLNNNCTELRLSPCLSDWISKPWKWTEPYYFVDHNDTAWLTMLSLIYPKLIKKTNTIVQG